MSDRFSYCFCWELILKKGFNWSNGEEVRLEHIYSSWRYLLENVPNLSKEFDFIINWKSARLGKKKFEQVGIDIKENVICLKTKYSIDVETILSNIEFSPFYYVQATDTILPISTGPFIPKEKMDQVEYLPNQYYPDPFEENLKFVLVQTPKNAIKSYNRKEIDITPSTLYSEKFLYGNGNKVETKLSNICSTLLLISEKAIQQKQNLQENACSKMVNIQSTPNYFFSEEFQFKRKRVPQGAKKECFKVGLADFYPNSEVVKEIFKSLEVELVKIPLDDLHDRKKHKNLDALYILFSPVIATPPSLLLTYLPYVEEIDAYVAYLNKYNLNQLSRQDKLEINDYLINQARLLPIGKIQHKYICRQGNWCFRIDENDVYHIEKNKK